MRYSNSVPPEVRVLFNGDQPPRGFVMRPRPVIPEFVVHCSWWPMQYHQRINGDSDSKVWLWIPKADNLAYERGEAFRKRHIIHEKRWCDARRKITVLRRGTSYWFPIKHYFTVVSSIHSVMEAYPSRRLVYIRLKRGLQSGVRVKRTQ